MMTTGTTFILGHSIKGQGQMWYFVCELLLARNRLILMRRSKWFAVRLTACNWILSPSVYPFVRVFIRVSAISSHLHFKIWWLNSIQI